MTLSNGVNGHAVSVDAYGAAHPRPRITKALYAVLCELRQARDAEGKRPTAEAIARTREAGERFDAVALVELQDCEVLR